MITEDYVSFEVAKLLKEKGFNEICFALYNPSEKLIQCGVMLNNTQVGRVEGSYSAPTLQMATKWLREVHKIDIDIVSRLSLNADNDHCYSYDIKHQYDKYHYKTYTDGEYLNFEESCEAAIKYCLENLI